MSIREQKRRETRERLAAAAMRLFRTRGYEATTVDMIASEAGVSPRTFFRYFEAKDGVLGGLGHDVVDEALERLSAQASLQEVCNVLSEVIELHLDEPDYALSLQLMRTTPSVADSMPLWRQRYSERLAAGLAAADGRPEPTLQERVRATTAIHCLAVVLDEWALERSEASLRELMGEALAELHLR